MASIIQSTSAETFQVVVEISHGDEPRKRGFEKRRGLRFSGSVESGSRDFVARGAVRVGRNDVEQQGRHSRVGEMCRDAGAHGARAENSNFMDTLHKCDSCNKKFKVLLWKFIYHPVVLASLDQNYFGEFAADVGYLEP